MKKHVIALTLIVVALAVVGVAEAAQSKALVKSKVVAIDVEGGVEAPKQLCSDSQAAMDACRSFIKGFLQGALLTDTAIIKTLEDTQPTFAERAIRTRLRGSRSSSPTALAGFCLPANRTVLELAEETLDHVKASEMSSVELANNIYDSLKVDYPCES